MTVVATITTTLDLQACLCQLTIAINTMALHLYSIQGSFHMAYTYFSKRLSHCFGQKCSITFISQKPMSCLQAPLQHHDCEQFGSNWK